MADILEEVELILTHIDQLKIHLFQKTQEHIDNKIFKMGRII